MNDKKKILIIAAYASVISAVIDVVRLLMGI